jgi:hypothetical protein
MKQAEKELQTAGDVLPRVARECYKWLLCPGLLSIDEPKPTVEVFPLNTSGPGLGGEVERVCVENELVIAKWSPWYSTAQMQRAVCCLFLHLATTDRRCKVEPSSADYRCPDFRAYQNSRGGFARPESAVPRSI